MYPGNFQELATLALARANDYCRGLAMHLLCAEDLRATAMPNFKFLPFTVPNKQNAFKALCVNFTL